MPAPSTWDDDDRIGVPTAGRTATLPPLPEPIAFRPSEPVELREGETELGRPPQVPAALDMLSDADRAVLRKLEEEQAAKRRAEELAQARKEAAERAARETEERLAREAAEAKAAEAARVAREKEEAAAAEAARIKAEQERPYREKLLAVAAQVAAIEVPAGPASAEVVALLAKATADIQAIAKRRALKKAS